MRSEPKRQLKLGLIGDNIAQSQSPHLHRTAGRLTGLDVTYDKLVPKTLGQSFDAVFERAVCDGLRGVNITFPYKEQATTKVVVHDPLVRAIGAVNTVIFGDTTHEGFNTDYTGFIHAYRNSDCPDNPGTVCLIGTGGVGKAVAFGLICLGADVIRCVDLDATKAQALAFAVQALGSDTQIEVASDARHAACGADGIINCTPLGMGGLGGTPLLAIDMAGAIWAFDAVYTPVKTQFLAAAMHAGLSVMSGYELFFHQGVEAWSIFSASEIDSAALRYAIGTQADILA